MTESVIYWKLRSEPVLTEQIVRRDLSCPGLTPDPLHWDEGFVIPVRAVEGEARIAAKPVQKAKR